MEENEKAVNRMVNQMKDNQELSNHKPIFSTPTQPDWSVIEEKFKKWLSERDDDFDLSLWDFRCMQSFILDTWKDGWNARDNEPITKERWEELFAIDRKEAVDTFRKKAIEELEKMKNKLVPCDTNHPEIGNICRSCEEGFSNCDYVDSGRAGNRIISEAQEKVRSL